MISYTIPSLNRDPVYQVLLHLHNHLTLGTFFRLIEDGGVRLAPASRLLQVYAREQNREMLRDFYYSDDRRVESAVLALGEASNMTVSKRPCDQESTHLTAKLRYPPGPFFENNGREIRSKVFFRRQG